MTVIFHCCHLLHFIKYIVCVFFLKILLKHRSHFYVSKLLKKNLLCWDYFAQMTADSAETGACCLQCPPMCLFCAIQQPENR